jgi:hypothetical protein
MDGQGTLLGVMTTDIAATLRSGNDAWHGTFTFTAAAPDGRTLSRGHGSLRGRRIAAPR